MSTHVQLIIPAHLTHAALWLHGNFSLELNAVKKVCKLKGWVIPESCEAELVGF
jgi:hypothetical protein